MFTRKFGLEIEFTGITRQKAAETVSEYLNGTATITGDYYDTQKITAPDGRIWKLMYDGSIKCQRKNGQRVISTSNDYSVELVSPILLYREDIDTIQALARRLRKAGGFANKSCGIHIHLDGASHTPRSIRNFVNIIYAHNDLLYKSLQIAPERMRYCQKMDAYLVEKMNQLKPKTLRQIESIWYEGYTGGRNNHYHQSRYHFLNLHSFFHGNHTVELRGFNSTLHAGKIRAYIVLALALNHQALTQRSASCRKVQEENEKFAMRVWLNRIGFIGDEFKACREHLYQHLDGNAAWRYGSKENVRSHINARNTRNGGTQNE
ncbi:MAG: amidoligase [Eubacterium sp.]|nr:amidoligase [Eubacterium sp.]